MIHLRFNGNPSFNGNHFSKIIDFIVHLGKKRCFFFHVFLKEQDGVAIPIYKEFMKWAHSRLHVCIHTHKHPCPFPQHTFYLIEEKLGLFYAYQTDLDS